MSWLESGMEKIRQSRESGRKKSLIKGPGTTGNYEKLGMVRRVYHGKNFTWCQEVKLARGKGNFMEGSLCQGKEFQLDYQKAARSEER